MVLPHPLSPALSISLAMVTPKNTEEEPDEPEPGDEGGIQMEYCSIISCTAQV